MLSLGQCKVLPLLWHRVLVKGYSEEQDGMLCLFGARVHWTYLVRNGLFCYSAQHTITSETSTSLCVLGKLPTSHKQGLRGEVRSRCPK